MAGFLSMCVFWKAPPQVPLTDLRPPEVPVLALSGALDVRTPFADASRVVAEYPRRHLLVVPAVGHDVLDNSSCARGALASWLDDGPIPSVCPPQGPALRPVPVPASTAGLPQAVAATVADAEAVLEIARLADGSASVQVAGLRGGGLSIAPGRGSVRLRGDAFVAGVHADGAIQVAGS